MPLVRGSPPALRAMQQRAERGTRTLSASVLSALVLGTGQARSSPQGHYRGR